MNAPALVFLKRPEVCARLRIGSGPALYRRIRAGVLPPPVKLGGSSLWIESEIEAVVNAVIGGMTKGELIQLVAQLLAERGAPARSSDIQPSRRDDRGRFACASPAPDAGG